MASGNYQRALALVLEHEGGWSDHPADPGGATMKGVTLATFRSFVPNATKDDLRNISTYMLGKIYREGYWQKVRGDDLPAGVDYAVFDFAVNSGPRRAIMALQRAVGVADDGRIGPITLAAVKRKSPEDIITRICSDRLSFMRRLSTWPTFGRGWQRRVEGVEREAIRMALAAASTPAPVIPRTYPPLTVEPAPAPAMGFRAWVRSLFRA
jgi:lysozyme family protein